MRTLFLFPSVKIDSNFDSMEKLFAGLTDSNTSAVQQTRKKERKKHLNNANQDDVGIREKTKIFVQI